MIGVKLFLLIFVFLAAPAQESPKKQSRIAEAHLERAKDFELDNDPRAEQEYRLAIQAKKGNYPEALRELSYYLQRHMRFSEAAEVLQKYIDQTSGENDKDDAEELDDLRRAARLKQNIQTANKPLLQDLIGYSKLVSRYADNQIIDALPYAERAVKFYADSAEAHLELARLLIGPGQGRRRCQVLQKAIALGAGLPIHYMDLGNCEMMLGEWQPAVEAFQKALALSNGKLTDALGGLGMAFAQLGRKKEAAEALRSFLESAKTTGPLRPEYEQQIKRMIEKLESPQ
jgi:tetratricopeptide (TPR) repeat protein